MCTFLSADTLQDCDDDAGGVQPVGGLLETEGNIELRAAVVTDDVSLFCLHHTIVLHQADFDVEI